MGPVMGDGGGVLTYKMGMYLPPYVKKKGAYGAGQPGGQTEKVGAFRAETTVKLYTFRADHTGENGCIQKVGAFRANRPEKVGAFRANKTQKGGLYRGTYPYCFRGDRG